MGRQAEFRELKVDYYDRKDVLLKTLLLSEYRQYEGRYWRAHVMFMDNHQTGKSTTLTWSHYIFGAGLSDREFDSNARPDRRANVVGADIHRHVTADHGCNQ